MASASPPMTSALVGIVTNAWPLPDGVKNYRSRILEKRYKMLIVRTIILVDHRYLTDNLLGDFDINTRIGSDNVRQSLIRKVH